MSIITIRQVIERRLGGVDTPIPTAHENTQTTQSPPYQRVFLMPASTEVSGFSDHAHSVDTGFMQVSLFYPTGAGAKDAMLQAERIRARFPAGYTEVESGFQIRITKKPHIEHGAVLDGVYCLPVSIHYEAIEL